ncbi:MAG: dual specificity protein phosphatase [Bacteriovoracaceae bacterium]|nr:dual specificity protein phosphatase [Bacteriovoracaceae bacterium]
MEDVLKHQCPQSLDVHWIDHSLLFGAKIAPEYFSHLYQCLQIRLVVDLRSEDKDDKILLSRLGIKFLHLPTADRTSPSTDDFYTGVYEIKKSLAANEKVFIHCEYGIGRSAILACGVLVSLGKTPLAALNSVKLCREKVSPSPEQLYGFIEWSLSWYKNLRSSNQIHYSAASNL